MALLIRLRQVIPRPSPIPHKCCSFFHAAPDLSSSRRENPSIRPTRSKHDPPPPVSLKKRFLSGPYSRQPDTKVPKGEIDSSKYPKPSPEEVINHFQSIIATVLGSVEDAKSFDEMSYKFKNGGLGIIKLLKVACMPQKRSVEDAKVIQKMSSKLKKSALAMTEQLKTMIQVSFVPLDVGIDKTKLEGYKTSLPSPPTLNYNRLREEDMVMIGEMPKQLKKYTKILKKFKAMHGYVSCSCDFHIHRKDKKFEAMHGYASHSCDFYIHHKDKKSKDYVETMETTCLPENGFSAIPQGIRGPFLDVLIPEATGDIDKYSDMRT